MADKNPIEEALQRRDQADFQAFMKLRELMNVTDYSPGREKLLKIIAEYNGNDVEDAKEFIKEIEEALEEREEANEAFMQAIKNNPIKPVKA